MGANKKWVSFSSLAHFSHRRSIAVQVKIGRRRRYYLQRLRPEESKFCHGMNRNQLKKKKKNKQKFFWKIMWKWKQKRKQKEEKEEEKEGEKEEEKGEGEGE